MTHSAVRSSDLRAQWNNDSDGCSEEFRSPFSCS